jgi:ribosomal protein L21E
MKLIKKNNKAGTINEAFKVGDVVTWNSSFFDGRVTELVEHTGTVVKVNKKTVDVEMANGNVFRLDAFIKISTGKWALA